MTSVVIMAAIMKFAIVEGVVLCILLGIYRNLGVTSCLLCCIKYTNMYDVSCDNEQLVLVTASCTRMVLYSWNSELL
jgi:hypothetical protein